MDKTIKLSNYYDEIYPKNKIVIGNTSSINMNHIKRWKNVGGGYKGITPYTIGLDGAIYEHYDPKYYSNFINIKNYDRNIIPIVIENEGWLTKNYKDNEFLTWCGDIYNRDGDVIEMKWRGKLRWVPYTQVQMDSLAYLCKELIDRFNIEPYVSDHNTKIDDIGEKEGIYYRSNYSTNYLDVSPAFNFNDLKNKIENNGTLG